MLGAFISFYFLLVGIGVRWYDGGSRSRSLNMKTLRSKKKKTECFCKKKKTEYFRKKQKSECLCCGCHCTVGGGGGVVRVERGGRESSFFNLFFPFFAFQRVSVICMVSITLSKSRGKLFYDKELAQT